MLLASGPVTTLGSPTPRVAFGEKGLLLDGEPAFATQRWCETCAYFFERLDGADHTLSVAALQDRLTTGLDGIDEDVLQTFSAILPAGRYLPLLLTVDPLLTRHGWPSDFFTGEQAALWGEFAPYSDVDPGTPYYRTFETQLDDGDPFFEFVVPFVKPDWNSLSTVAEHAERLRTTSSPTAVALSMLTVVDPWSSAMSEDVHWCLTHFLLDGHHKMQAAALTGQPLRLLSLVSTDESPAGEKAVARLPELRNRPRTAR